MDKDLAWLKLSLVPGIGPRTMRKIYDVCPSLEFLNVTNAQAMEVEYAIPIKLGRILQKHYFSSENQSKAEKEKTLAEKNQVQMLTPLNALYPPKLLELPDPPPILYVQGSTALFGHMAVAVVGTRRATYYGTKFTQTILAQLAELEPNLCIISGLALGIDTTAHKAALQNKLPTIAVLGNGLPNIYPPANAGLAEKIISAGGAILSEFPLQSPPTTGNFPARNRIISGLSLAVLVMEAHMKSGSLITANRALEQNREVFALMGPLDADNYQGCLHLIDNQKATTLTSGKAVLDAILPIHRLPSETLTAFTNTANNTAPASTLESKTFDFGFTPEFFFQSSQGVAHAEIFSPDIAWDGQEDPLAPLKHTPAVDDKPTQPLLDPVSAVDPKNFPAKQSRSKNSETPLSAEQQKICQFLQQGPQSLEKICADLKLEPGVALANLLQLEIEGLLSEAKAGYYELSHNTPT